LILSSRRWYEAQTKNNSTDNLLYVYGRFEYFFLEKTRQVVQDMIHLRQERPPCIPAPTSMIDALVAIMFFSEIIPSLWIILTHSLLLTEIQDCFRLLLFLVIWSLISVSSSNLRMACKIREWLESPKTVYPPVENMFLVNIMIRTFLRLAPRRIRKLKTYLAFQSLSYQVLFQPRFHYFLEKFIEFVVYNFNFPVRKNNDFLHQNCL
jgi:hypothetical protein